MRSASIRCSLLLAVMIMLLTLLVGCGFKSEEKDSGDYYTGPIKGKSGVQTGGNGKQD